MLVLMKMGLDFFLKLIMLSAVKRYKYKAVVDQILSSLNKLYNTDEYTKAEYPMRLSDNLVAEYYNPLNDKNIVTFSLPERNGKAYIENFDLSCLEFLKNHLFYITRYSKVDHIHTIAYYNNGKIIEFNFFLNIYYPYHPKKVDNYIELSITTDIQFNLVNLVRKSCLYSENKKFSKHLIKNNVSFEDELNLVKLKIQSQNPEINRLIPEINTPSAYDFNSEDLKNRLLMVEMMEC
jgi:hypothetical protein